jgi:TIR domain
VAVPGRGEGRALTVFDRRLNRSSIHEPNMITTSTPAFDVFISHASEDKGRFVDALDTALRERGVTCWYDARAIQLGDDFRRRMDEGLSHARFGVVVLSPNFFKYWPEAELSALFNQEATFNQSRILPVRLDLDRATLTQHLPLLAARAEVSWELGVPTVADRIRDVVRSSGLSTRSGRSRAYNLPVRRARTLFGREPDMQRLVAALMAGQSVRVAASVEGLAGVGKTELALHLVDRLSETDRFPGGIFWFDSENPNLTAVWGGPIADSLAVGTGPLEERAAAAIRLVSAGPPTLVVLDNVERWTRESEPHPLPAGSHVSLLVTTRSRFLAGPSFEHYTLDVLDPLAAQAFLAALSGRDVVLEGGAEELLAYLGGHTLALAGGRVSSRISNRVVWNLRAQAGGRGRRRGARIGSRPVRAHGSPSTRCPPPSS